MNWTARGTIIGAGIATLMILQRRDFLVDEVLLLLGIAIVAAMMAYMQKR
jgi:multisubunit Na+/H+ antiporter MnhG subunit